MRMNRDYMSAYVRVKRDFRAALIFLILARRAACWAAVFLLPPLRPSAAAAWFFAFFATRYPLRKKCGPRTHLAVIDSEFFTRYTN